MISSIIQPIIKPIISSVVDIASSSAPNISDMFSVDLGTGARTVTNGLDLASSGGMVWSKSRVNVESHQMYDTVRGVNEKITSDAVTIETTDAQGVTSFNSNGFTLGTSVTGSAVSWSFLKAARFFDIVTYVGDGVAGKEVAHNLGVIPGQVFAKCLDSNTSWQTQHISRGGSNRMRLDLNASESFVPLSVFWNDVAADASNITLGIDTSVNTLNKNYVLYVFAHDVEDDGVIQCSEYAGTNGDHDIALGWRPQYIMIKRVGAGDWVIVDTARGISTGSNPYIEANETNAEQSITSIELLETGFKVKGSSTDWNASGSNYTYMAIREA